MKGWYAQVAVGLAASLTGCNQAVRLTTAQPASWAYVTASWGGMAVEQAGVTAQRVALPYHLGLTRPTHIDSAICPGRTRATVEPGRVLVQVDRELCNSASKQPYVIEFDRPAAGQYVIAYDDAQAGYPRLGSVSIPEDTQSTLDRLGPLVQGHRWREASELLQTADPARDAENAFAADHARYFTGGNFYFSLPSVPNSEAMYKEFDAWQPFPGTGDSSKSKQESAYQEVAAGYIARFNARLVELRSKP